MKFKGLQMATLLSVALFGAHSASASSAYMAAGGIFATKYPGNTTTCFVCHTGSPGTFTAYGTQFKAAGGTGGGAGTVAQLTAIDGLDADGDGYTNGQEVNGTSDLNLNTSSPFTVAATASATAVTDTVLTNFVVTGDSYATAQVFTDPYSLATAGSTQIIGNESLTINNAPVDVYHKSSGVDNTMTLYMVDPYGVGTVSPQGTGWTANADGSLHIVALAPGTTSVTGVMVRSIPTTTVTGTTTPITTTGDNENDSDNEGSSSTGVGCVTGQLSTPLIIFLAMLSLVFVVRRKNS